MVFVLGLISAAFGCLCMLWAAFVHGRNYETLCYMGATALLLSVVIMFAWAMSLPPTVDVW